MTVIHANFGGASAPPTPPQAPPVRSLSAAERTMKAIASLSSILLDRGRMTAEEREQRAVQLEESAVRCASSKEGGLTMIEIAGMHAMAAKILRAGD